MSDEDGRWLRSACSAAGCDTSAPLLLLPCTGGGVAALEDSMFAVEAMAAWHARSVDSLVAVDTHATAESRGLGMKQFLHAIFVVPSGCMPGRKSRDALRVEIGALAAQHGKLALTLTVDSTRLYHALTRSLCAPGGKVVEWGSAYGDACAIAARAVAPHGTVLGIDTSFEAVEESRKRHPSIAFARFDVIEQPREVAAATAGCDVLLVDINGIRAAADVAKVLALVAAAPASELPKVVIIKSSKLYRLAATATAAATQQHRNAAGGGAPRAAGITVLPKQDEWCEALDVLASDFKRSMSSKTSRRRRHRHQAIAVAAAAAAGRETTDATATATPPPVLVIVRQDVFDAASVAALHAIIGGVATEDVEEEAGSTAGDDVAPISAAMARCGVVVLDRKVRSQLLSAIAHEAAAVVISGRKGESSPMALLDAMALGTPVIARDTAAHRALLGCDAHGGNAERGLLYRTPREFVIAAEFALSRSESSVAAVGALVAAAKARIATHHSEGVDIEEYSALVAEAKGVGAMKADGGKGEAQGNDRSNELKTKI